MKPIASTITEIDTLEGDEVKARISQDNAPWIMRSMADLYSNRELAVIREYSTNAYDSNVEKAMRDGHDVEPIRVTLPNAMNPYFSVQDFGVGMSEETMREVYLTFGESSKRDSDDFNGMLGFGSKSAVAYTNTFTVTSIHKGIKTVGVITRREDAMGGYLVTMKMVITGMHTSERDGVLIQVPVHNWREFEQKARDFYRFWLPGRVLVNGREPEWAVGEKIDNNLYYSAAAGNSYVVMGNVPYRINNPEALFPRGMNRISFVAYVPVGAVEFVPAREALKYSDHTKNNLQKIITDFVTKSVELAKKEIGEAKTHSEAFKAWTKWRKVIGTGQVDDLTFKGDKLVDSFSIKGDRWDTGGYRYSTWSIERWNLADMYRTIIVTGFDVQTLTAAHKRKMKAWMNAKNRSRQYVIFIEDKKVNCVWVSDDDVVDWETVKAEAPKPAPRPRVQQAWGRKAGTFDLVTQTGIKAEQDVPQTKELWYIMVQDFNKAEDRRSLTKLLNEFKMDVEVVKVPANRKDKFLRHYPHAKPILSHFESSVILDGMSLLSDEAKIFLSTHHDERLTISKLDPQKIDDPQLVKTVTIFQKDERHYLEDYIKHERLATMMGIQHKFKRHPWQGYWDAKAKPLTASYPLAAMARSVNKDHMAHVYLYINSVYKTRKDGLNV